MDEVSIKIVNLSENNIPQYATAGSAGMDVCAHLNEPVVFKPFQRHLVPTGLFIQIPDGYEAQIRPRSGLALKHGITCLNSPGTIDSDYRGELKVILINLSDTEYTISKGERIAQMIVSKVEKAKWELVDELDETKRGRGGFGHTGNI